MSEERVKLSIKGKKKSKPIIPELELFLKQNDDGVTLYGRASTGFEWNLFVIRSDGKFDRCGGVEFGETGLQVNKNGQILEAK